MNKKGRMVSKKHRKKIKRTKERRKAMRAKARKVPAGKETASESRQ